jgi:hypothetical protein
LAKIDAALGMLNDYANKRNVNNTTVRVRQKITHAKEDEEQQRSITIFYSPKLYLQIL